MKKVKVIIGAFAFLVAMTAAFAFTPVKKDSAKSPKTTIWLKYDCATQQPLVVTSGTNYSFSQFPVSDCPNFSDHICSVQLDLETETEQIPNTATGNRRPIVNITNKDKQFCDLQ